MVSLLGRVEHVAQGIADQVEGQRQQQDRRAGNEDQPGRAGEIGLVLEDDVAQEGVGGCTPMPRKDSVASKSTVVAMPSVAQTIMVEKRCGRICLRMMRGAPAPIARSASMKSRSESERVSV